MKAHAVWVLFKDKYMNNLESAKQVMREISNPANYHAFVESAKTIDLSPFEFNTINPLVEPNYRLNIFGVDVISDGSLCVVCGEEKKGKSQFLGLIVSVLLSGKPFGAMGAKQTSNSIVWLDTEQSQFDFGCNIERVYKHAGYSWGGNIHSIGLHAYLQRGVPNKVEILAAAVEQHNPDLVVIDGIKDYVDDFNDVSQSKAALDYIDALLRERPNLAVLTMIHTNHNKNDEKMRGHIGSLIHERYSERFTCKKTNNVFEVIHEGRHKPLPSPFRFQIVDDGHAGAWEISGADDAAGAICSNEALRLALADGGKTYDEAVNEYAKLAGVTKKAARGILHELFDRGKIVNVNGKYILRES